VIASTFSGIHDFFASGTWQVIRNLVVFFLIAFWLAVVSGLGLVNATTRYVPQLRARGEVAALHHLIGNLLTLH
jgi:hypothetical protein